MTSSIINGQVFHKRFFPQEHHFRYPLTMVCLDLDDLDHLDRTCRAFAYNGRGLVSIHDKDYLGPGPDSIREKLNKVLAKSGYSKAIHRVFLVTAPRRLFSVFNPVSFYFCMTTDQIVDCVVAEVNNTFGERHAYVLLPNHKQKKLGASSSKRFHVSPFNRVEGDYVFSFAPLNKGVDIRIIYRLGGRKKFIARYWGEFTPLNGSSLMTLSLKHPLRPHLTMTRILKEAAILFMKKKLPYIPKPVNTHEMTLAKRPSNVIQSLCERVLIREMTRLKRGCVRVTFPDGKNRVFGNPASPHKGEMTILDYDFFPKVVLEGDIGFGESFTEHYFTTPDLKALVEVFILAFSGGSIPGRLASFALGALVRMIRGNSPNTLAGSRENIQSHYDLSNDFYALMLDKGMNYSAGVFFTPDDSLETAQKNKIKGIIDKAKITQVDHVLEIGSGWGDFAVTAAMTTGCSVTTITLSRQQHAFVTRRIRDLGLEDQVQVLLTDYRNVRGRYDKIVSIEMLEAVGPEYLASFFKRCNALLKKDGRMVLQVITLPDQEYTAYRFRLDWIQKHIFPGGHLPSLSVITRTLTRHTPFIIDHLENIGPDYATTLDHWHQRFSHHINQVEALGFDPVFQRKWTYYLKSCEAMFRVNALEDLQLVLVRPYERIS